MCANAQVVLMRWATGIAIIVRMVQAMSRFVIATVSIVIVMVVLGFTRRYDRRVMMVADVRS